MISFDFQLKKEYISPDPSKNINQDFIKNFFYILTLNFFSFGNTIFNFAVNVQLHTIKYIIDSKVNL